MNAARCLALIYYHGEEAACVFLNHNRLSHTEGRNVVHEVHEGSKRLRRVGKIGYMDVQMG